MPRIRKKTSKRISTHQRAKFKHKVAEGRKKKKKEAKKNPQWKSKKKKDPGIPNNFPYKDQILAEVAESRRQAEEAKRQRREEKKAARELVEQGECDVGPGDGPDDGPDEKVSSSEDQTKHEAPLLLNPDLPNLKAVLEKADVVLLVLDARDPASYRLPHVEELVSANEKAKLVLVINKIDLVPQESLVAWAAHLRTQHATFLFRAASSFLPKIPLNDPKLKGKAKETATDAKGAEALLEYLGQRATLFQSETLQVAVVGLTNSGKSAIVNSLARQAIVPIYAPTSSTDAWKTTTTRAFEVPVEVAGRKMNLVDTPGVSLQVDQGHDEALKTRDMLLRSRGRVDKVKDPVPAVEHIVSRADTRDLMVHYNLPAFAQGDCGAFLAGVARSTGLLKKGGKADLTQAARTVLRNWTTGKLPFYTDAPKEGAVGEVGDGGGEEAWLGEVYRRGDEEAVVGVRGKKEMRRAGGLVRIGRGEVEARRVVLDVPFVVGEGESQGEREGEGEDEESVGGGGEEEDEEGQDGGEDEDEDEEEDEDEGDEESSEDEFKGLSTPPLTGKRKRQRADADVAPTSTPARPAKKVAFAAGTQDRQERRQARVVPRSAAKPVTKTTSKAATKATSMLATKAPSKPSLKKTASAPAAKAKTGTRSTTGANANAYDFDQFFKS